jgi:TMEM175 potassium channel family protein
MPVRLTGARPRAVGSQAGRQTEGRPPPAAERASADDPVLPPPPDAPEEEDTTLEERQGVELRLERVVFFSDAVFAIAMTLLVVNLPVPAFVGPVSQQRLADALAADLPRVFAYVLSFFVIGSYWLAHWRRYALVKRVDDRLVALNLLLLGFVAVIPFPSALLGQYGAQPLAVVIYALVLAAGGLVGTAAWLYAARRHLLRTHVSPAEVRLGTLRGLAAPAILLASLLVLPFAGPGPVELLWLLIVPLYWVIPRVMEREAAN